MKKVEIKIDKIRISRAFSTVLSWSLGILLAVGSLNLLNHWVGTATDADADLLSGLHVMRGLDGFETIMEALFLVCEVLILDVLRRGFVRLSRFSLQLLVVVLMVFVALNGVASLWSSGVEVTEGANVVVSEFEGFRRNFVPLTAMVVYGAELALGGVLTVFYRGSLRLLGVALMVCPTLVLMLSGVYTYLYTEVGGLTLAELSTYYGLMRVASFVLSVLPFVLVRKAVEGAED